MTKSAVVTDVNGDGKTDLGDTISWSFLVKNTGTTTITNLTVSRPDCGCGDLSDRPAGAGPVDDVHATTPHTITQADVDAGVVSNTATAHGTDPKGTDGAVQPVRHRHPGRADRRAQLTKSAAVTDVNGDCKTDLGDTIAWSFLVKNTGTTTITNVSVIDPIAGAVTCPTAPLAPGAVDDLHGDNAAHHHPG